MSNEMSACAQGVRVGDQSNPNRLNHPQVAHQGLLNRMLRKWCLTPFFPPFFSDRKIAAYKKVILESDKLIKAASLGMFVSLGAPNSFADYEVPTPSLFLNDAGGIPASYAWLTPKFTALGWKWELENYVCSGAVFETDLIYVENPSFYGVVAKSPLNLYARAVAVVPGQGGGVWCGGTPIHGAIYHAPTCGWANYPFSGGDNPQESLGVLTSRRKLDGTWLHTCAVKSAYSPKPQNGVCRVGNPVHPGTGAKTVKETDYSNGLLQFSRYYDSSLRGVRGDIGAKWHHTYQRNIQLIDATVETVEKALLFREDGSIIEFRNQGGGWLADADINDKLRRLVDSSGVPVGWQYTTSGDVVELYDASGKLLDIKNRGGRGQTLRYDAKNQLISVVDDVGRELTFSYDAVEVLGPPGTARILSMTDPAGGVYKYSYDGGRLISVTYPDDTPGDDTDNPKRVYHYNETAYSSNVNVNQTYALTGITDEGGIRFATYKYDDVGRAISTEHSGGVDKYTLAYTADASGNPVSTVVTDPLNSTRTINMQTILGVVKSTGQSQPGGSGCGAASAATSYYANGNVASRTDFNGNKTCYAYDLTRNLESARVEGIAPGKACPANIAGYTPTSGTVERVITTDWDSSFRLPASITEPGRMTSYGYDTQGNLAQKSIRDTATNATRIWNWSYTYSATVPGLLVQKVEDGPRTNIGDLTTTTDYYSPEENCAGGHFGCRAQVRQITNALGHTTQISRYTAHGQPEELIDPNGLVTTLSYDPRQRLTQRSVGSELTRYDYDAVGQLKQVILPAGGVVRYDYDAAHRLTDIWDEENNRIHYTLDPMGNRTQEDVYDALGTPVATKSRVFDALNRLWKDIGALNQTTVYEYDANGNLTKTDGPLANPRKTTDPKDVIQNSYDALNRLASTTDGFMGVTRYGYDSVDQLVNVTDPRNVTTIYDVNAFGEQTRITSPDSGITDKTYDAAGNLKTSTDARGKQSVYSHDALNRLTGISFTSGNPISFSYDAGAASLGRLTGMTDESGSTQWQYDLHGRVTQKTVLVGGVPRSIGYHYDPQGRLDQMTYPSGKVLTLTLRASKLDSLTLDGQPVLANVQYHPFSGPRQWSFGNGQQVSRGYDADNRLTVYPLGNTTRSLVFDDAGRITRIDDSNPAYTQTLGYDNLDRLTRWSTQLLSQGYSYDAGSNRTSIVFSRTASYSHVVAPTSNRLQSVSGPAAKTYQHDAAGNVTHDGRTTFTYNDRGRLASASNSQGSTSYLINGLGQRAVKTGLEGIRFVYDESGKLLGEYDPGGTLLQETLYLGDIPVAVVK